MRVWSFLLVFVTCFFNALAVLGQFKKSNLQLKQKETASFTAFVTVPDDAFDATSTLPNNYVKDGSIDYTKNIQSALDKHDVVILPDFPILTTGVFAKSNQKIYFNRNSKLVMKPTAQTHYSILGIIGVENVRVYNAVIVGDRKQHQGDKGEWGYGIDIRGARNVDIINCNVSDCWGDGIVISKSKSIVKPGIQLLETHDINIVRSVLNYNRRNGITIAGGKNINIQDAYIANTMGTAPQAAIMIEPDNSKYILDYITVKNVQTFNNYFGLAVNLNLYATAEDKAITLTVDGARFSNSHTSLYFASFSRPQNYNLAGNINLRNISSKNSSRN